MRSWTEGPTSTAPPRTLTPHLLPTLASHDPGQRVQLTRAELTRIDGGALTSGGDLGRAYEQVDLDAELAERKIQDEQPRRIEGM